MNQSIITLNPNKPDFVGNPALSKYTNTIYDAVAKQAAINETFAKAEEKHNADSEGTRKVLARTLARIKADKAFEKSGFKSLEDYAARIGIDTSLCHKLENAGRLLISDNETIRDFASKTDYSKLSILSSAKEDALEKAIKEEELTPDKTQKEVANWKKLTSPAKPKVLPLYDIRARFFGLDGKFTDVDYPAVAFESVADFDGVDWKSFKNPDNDNAPPVKMGLSRESLPVIILSMVKVDKPKDKPKDKPAAIDLSSMTQDEKDALLAQLLAK